MKTRLTVLAIVAAMLLVTSCAPAATEDPVATSTPVTTSSPAPTEAPTPDILVEPETAFDLDCAAFASEVEQITGVPVGEVAEQMDALGGVQWLPGPGEFSAQRATGQACGVRSDSTSWEVVTVPGAPEVVAALDAKGYPFPADDTCSPEYCVVQVVSGDVALSFAMTGWPGEGDALGQLRSLLQRTADLLAGEQREADTVPSAIANAECEQFLTPEQLESLTGILTKPQSEFGGWGYEAHVYFTMGGSKYCVFFDEVGGGELDRERPVTVTTLPAGAWAFGRLEGRTEIDIPGAVKAFEGDGAIGRYVDILVGQDWLRVHTAESVTGPNEIAATVAQNVRELQETH